MQSHGSMTWHSTRIDDVAEGYGPGLCRRHSRRHRAGTGMPMAAVTTRRRRLNVVKRSALTARAMPTAAPMPTGPVGVPRAVPTASSMPTAPSAYMDLCRRLFYAYGLPLAVGIAAFMPTGAVGKRSFSGSERPIATHKKKK